MHDSSRSNADAFGPLPARRPSTPLDTPPPVSARSHLVIAEASSYRRSPEFVAGLTRARKRAKRGYIIAATLPLSYVVAALFAFWASGGHPVP